MKSHIRILWAAVVSVPSISITLFMVLFLAQPHLASSAPLNPASYSSSTTNHTDNPKPQIWIFIVALIGIAVVGYIIYQLYQMAQKIPPPDPPPQSPTNSPPVVINPSGSPGPAGATITASFAPSNPVNLDTNHPVTGVMGWYDIRYLNYKDTWAASPSLFSAYWSTGMTLSTNLMNWEDSHYRIDAFISDTGTFFAYFHYDTNYYNCYFTESTRARAYFDMTDQPQRPAQFFRLDPR